MLRKVWSRATPSDLFEVDMILCLVAVRIA